MEPFDLAVVGAGIVGATAAYLAGQERPDWRILLVDRSLVGHGATQYSVGLDFPYGRTAAHRRLASTSTSAYRELKAAIPDLPIYQLPLFGVVRRARLDEVLAGFVEAGARPADEQELARLRRSYPGLAIADEQVALTGCAGGFGFPRLVTAALVNRFKAGERAACWEGVEIQALHGGQGAFALEAADGRTIAARRVLVATGPWILRGPGAEAARAAGVRIKKIVALHIARRPTPDEPLIFFFDDDAFLLPVYERGEWIFSFASQEWDCAPDISQLRISAADRALALSILGRYCPSFVEECRGGRVFCDAYSPGWAPVAAQLPEMADAVIAGACSGSGYRLAPGIAAEALGLLSGYPGR